ncbi:flagellar hook-associated protein FlgK [Nocardioides ferulae]|uniref:flagellar hook-associated protein FlgK n=1 Tax=Nocardioides ferulae TaxID=2340821 RepID=UPI000EB05C73|nr:flagellar hook-associated protein FlgK [Nocardioides ferulae]
MSSFGSLNTALTALRFQQTSMDVASTNVANVATEGYVRRRVVGQTLGAAAQPALWAHNTDVGAGVTSKGVQRMTDALLDARQRREHAAQSYLDLTAEVLARVETGLGEPGENGVAAAIDGFRSSLHDLENNPGSAATRSQVLSAAGTLANAIGLQARHFQGEAADQGVRLQVGLSEVNRLAGDLAKTNTTIAAGKGTDTSSLLDTRDRLALRIAELTGAAATIQDDGQMTVTLQGQTLVSGDQAHELVVTGGFDVDGQLDGEQVTFAIDDGSGPVDLDATIGGELGAVGNLINTVLPDYLTQLNTLATQLADSVNAQHGLGFDQAGDAGVDLFDYDPDNAASSLKIHDDIAGRPELVAASLVSGGPNRDGSNGAELAGKIAIEDGYLRLVNDFGTKVASASRLAANQATLTGQIDTARDQQAGVSLDEETVNLLMAQRGYEAAARVMSTLDEVLDTLINRMAI